LRRALKSSVSRSVKEKRGHTSDQGEVWNEVASLNASHGVESETVGEGVGYRAESADGDHASALAIADTVVHGSVLVAV